jgi:hypothetical protein
VSFLKHSNFSSYCYHVSILCNLTHKCGHTTIFLHSRGGHLPSYPVSKDVAPLAHREIHLEPEKMKTMQPREGTNYHYVHACTWSEEYVMASLIWNNLARSSYTASPSSGRLGCSSGTVGRGPRPWKWRSHVESCVVNWLHSFLTCSLYFGINL